MSFVHIKVFNNRKKITENFRIVVVQIMFDNIQNPPTHRPFANAKMNVKD